MISNKEKYVNLSTQKKDGSLVNTPVWFAQDGDKNDFYIFSAGEAGKVKRIRNNGRATIYITNQSGSQKLSESLDVKGSIITEPEAKAEAVGIIKKKYGVISKMFLRGPDENRAIIKLDELGGE
mgnify:CR=1 FL=1